MYRRNLQSRPQPLINKHIPPPPPQNLPPQNLPPQNLPPQNLPREIVSREIVSREIVQESVIIEEKTNLKLYSSNIPGKIDKSVCICILMKTFENFDYIRKNLSKLQTIFNKSFIVFIANNEMSELCTKFENAITITTNFEEEYEKRNLYLKFVHENKELFDYMLVLDPKISLTLNIPSFDFLNKENLDFSAMFANQTYKYYDIENLVDDKKQIYLLKDPEVKKEKIKKYQVHIPRNSNLIPVKSAFGGAAIYDINVLDSDIKYTVDNHITFNLKISKKYSKMYIDPSFLIETSPNNSFLYEK